EDEDFLDLYAGSGAVGLEAVSRGARRAVLVESHPAALRALDANVKLLAARGAAPDSLAPVRREARAYCAAEAREGGARFAVVFADPPFGQDFSGLADAVRPLLAEDGVAVIQYPARHPPDFLAAADRVLTYGESGLALFKGHASAPA
ncbi:MAG TPA: RsmD family RNA methyltransferase, partial [Fibrobacteria bacterium]|nr:RsmD family RNA methyltransferase [Fibrobacteria bacterium]